MNVPFTLHSDTAAVLLGIKTDERMRKRAQEPKVTRNSDARPLDNGEERFFLRSLRRS